MKISVFIESTNRRVDVNLKRNASVAALLKKLKINSGEVVVKEDRIVTEDTKLANRDKIKILSVISGG